LTVTPYEVGRILKVLINFYTYPRIDIMWASTIDLEGIDLAVINALSEKLLKES